MSRIVRNSFTTYTGREVNVLQPKVSDICFEDIARSLARIQRYGGHCHSAYSVGEHSVVVSHLCNPRNALLGLLHDASEAYVGDWVSPLKRGVKGYKEIEARWMLAISEAAGLGDALLHLPEDIHLADKVAYQTELRDLFMPGRSDPSGLPPTDITVKGQPLIRGLETVHAYAWFVDRFNELTGVRF